MNSFFFTLVLQNAGVHLTNLEDLLFEAGCSDALICSYNNTVYLEFDRTAVSADIAISSAINDITEAGLHCYVWFSYSVTKRSKNTLPACDKKYWFTPDLNAKLRMAIKVKALSQLSKFTALRIALNSSFSLRAL